MANLVRSYGVILMVVTAATAVAQQPAPTAARLRADARVPLAPPLTVGGGEVVLDVAVGPDGAVTAVTPVRATPPFTDLLTAAIKTWQFDPARARRAGALEPADGHVLVAAVFRPPQVYLGPTLGAPPSDLATLAPELPAPSAMPMPPTYPPRATRDGTVLIELDVTMAGVVRGARLMSPATPFDAAALEAVKAWRFDFPRTPSGAPQLFVYAVVGFREPITQHVR